MEIISKNEKDTEKIAKMIAKRVKPSALICLFGDLGAGKTTFTKFFCKALKVKGEVKSPTFVLERQYENKKLVVHHYDLYRIEKKNQLEDLQIIENLEMGDICLIEWPEIALDILPERKIKIKIFKEKNDTRKFIIEGLE